jgi:hypothetical protein
MDGYLLAGVLAATLLVELISHRMERKYLYNRIMSKDLTEYKGTKKIKPIKNIIRKNLSKQNSSE